MSIHVLLRSHIINITILNINIILSDITHQKILLLRNKENVSIDMLFINSYMFTCYHNRLRCYNYLTVPFFHETGFNSECLLTSIFQILSLNLLLFNKHCVLNLVVSQGAFLG